MPRRARFLRPPSSTARHRGGTGMTLSDNPTRRRTVKGMSALTAVLLIAALLPLTAIVDLVASSSSAQAAATIDNLNITAQMSDNHGANSSGTAIPANDKNDCIRYGADNSASNSGGTSTSTAWLANPRVVYAAHGYGSKCPGNLDTSQQSAVGFQPVSTSSINTGSTFLLGRMQHNNNPISSNTDNYYVGNLNITLAGTKMAFPWWLWETPNQSSPCANPNGPNSNGCADEVKFTSQIGDKSFVQGGITYKLVVGGFTSAKSDNSCPPSPSGSYVNDFWTKEQATTYGCLYATVQQVRSLTIVKQIQAPNGAPSPIPTFTYAATSTLAGSPWNGTNTTLAPKGLGAAGQASATQEFIAGETVKVTENAQSGDWALTSLKCVDGNGNGVGTVSGGTFTLNGDLSTTDPNAVPITCTYVNTYTPHATLTLVKIVNSTGQPGTAATKASWTLNAAGPTAISGTGTSNAIVNQSVIAGTYTLGETATGSNTSGYQQAGNWVCSNGSKSVTLGGTATNPTLALGVGDNVTCTVTNKYQVGSLAVTKTVAADSAAYSRGTGVSFTASYVCTANGTTVANGTVSVTPNATNGQKGAVATVPDLPAGASCVVAETNAPTGSTNLSNTSYAWGAPTYAASSTVVIPTGGTAQVDITNPVNQNTGSLTIAKAVVARAGVPAAGYTGGDRTFPITYTCALGGKTVKTDTVNVKAGASQTVTGIPATAVCSFTEVENYQAGDFADASYGWDGNLLPNPVTVTMDGTATATVTNYFTRNLAPLTLAKLVSGSGYSGTGADFAVHYDCGAPYVDTVNVKSGGQVVVQVPAGVACAVSEVAPNGSLLSGGYVWNTPTYTGLTSGAVTVPKSGATVTVNNSTSIGYGQLKVTKAITGDATQIGSGTTFPIRVVCDAPQRGATANYDNTFAVAAGASATTPYLPINAKCSVTESPAPTGSTSLPADGSFVWGVAPVAQNATIPASTTPVAVTVTNTVTRAYGTLAIVKKVVDNTGAAPTETFSGTWTCTHSGDANATGTWSVTGAGNATLTGDTAKILLGSACSVTENDPAAAVPGDSSYVWTKAVPAPVAVTVASPHAITTVTNTLDRTAGTFSISKAITGAAAGVGYPAAATFPFTYTCTPAGGGSPITGTVSVPAGGAAGPSGTQIPSGSTCTVTEGTNPAPIDPYRWGSVTLSTAHAASATAQSGRSITFTTDAKGSTVNVSAVNDMHSASASVTVTKRVTGETTGYSGGDATLFPVTLTCGGVAIGTRLVADGGTVTFDGIPLGVSCSVTEGAFSGGLKDGSYAWGTASFSGPVKVEDGGASLIVTNPIERVYGAIGVTKVFDDNGFAGVVASNKQYSGTWTCVYGSGPGATTVSGTWSGSGSAAGTPAGLTGVPTTGILLGSACTATESALGSPSGADSSYAWATPRVAGATVSATGATVVVTNTLQRQTADLTVSKAVTGQTQGYTPADGFAGFPVGVTCYLGAPSDQTVLQANVTVQNGATVPLISGVPVGWTCVVTEGSFTGQLENASYAWGTPTVTIGTDGNTGASDIVKVTTAGATYAAHIANPIHRVTGTIGITKAIAANTPDGVVTDDAPFSGTYACVYNAGKADQERFSGTWARTGAGKATLTPANGQSTQLPIGTSCSAAESTPSASGLVDASWTWAAPIVSADVTVTNAQSVPVITVTNTPKRVFGALTITKKYTGVDGAFANGATVTGSWSCSYDGASAASGSWTLPAAGGTVTVGTDAIPVTADCIVREATLDDAVLTDASFTWNTPTYSPAQTVDGASVGEVTVHDARAAVTVTNSTQRVYATFGITKAVSLGAGVDHAKLDTGLTFSGTYSCTYGTDAPVTGTWSTTEGATWTSGAVLVGSVCQVATENAPAAPSSSDASYQWAGEQYGNPVTLTRDHSPKITVTNTVQRVTGTFGVTKVVAGDVDGEATGSTYGFDWQCTAKNGDVFPGAQPGLTAKIAAGEVWNAPDTIPVGSTCIVRELKPPAPTDPSYAWSTAYGVTGVGESGSSAVDNGISFVVPSGTTPVMVTATNTLTRTVGSYTVNKSATPVSGSTVQPGQTITYHVTVTPGAVGFVKGVVVTDDLTGVLDNADLQSVGSITAPQGTVSLQPGDQLVWNVGTVHAGTPLVLDYTVTVHDDAFGVTLHNVITTTGEVPPACGEAGCTTTTDHYTPAWLLTKTSNPASGTVVDQGGTITYTLTAKNTSKALVHAATADDDLGGLLDAADLVKPLDPSLTLAADGKSLAWAVPDLNPGASATVTYQVTVKADAFNVNVDNLVTPDGQGGSCPDAEKQQDGSCTTTNRVKDVDLALVKSHLPIAGDAVDSGKGDTIDYVLAVTNKGQDAATSVTVNDTLPAGLSPVDGTVTAPSGWTVAFSGDKLTATFPGPFAANATANITFTALVGTLTRSGIDKPFPDIVNSACVTEKQADANPSDNCSTDTTKVKSIAVVADAKCVNDTPLVQYSITPFDLTGSPKIALIWWTADGYAHRDPSINASDTAALLNDGAQKVDYVPVPSGWVSGQTITGSQLWPGAAVDAKGTPIAWPGWSKMPDGTWVLNPKAPFYNLRGQAVVEVRINPSTAASEIYPPASPNCNAAPPKQDPPKGMADTGSNLAPTLGTAAALLALGSLLLLWFARRRRRDGQPE